MSTLLGASSRSGGAELRDLHPPHVTPPLAQGSASPGPMQKPGFPRFCSGKSPFQTPLSQRLRKATPRCYVHTWNSRRGGRITCFPG